MRSKLRHQLRGAVDQGRGTQRRRNRTRYGRIRHEPNCGLIVLPNPVTEANRKLIISMAARHRLPAVYAFPFFARDGGLISYGVDLPDQYRQAASYADRILRGEKPADLPVQQSAPSSRWSSTSRPPKRLASKIPPNLLARADEVIE